MSTVPQPPTTRKPMRAFHAQFHGLSGVLTKPADRILFMRDTGEVVPITDTNDPDLTVLGEVAEAMQQYIADMQAGGYAALACSRAN